MIKTYQESEEIKSNSLDIELKKKQIELQEKSTSITELTRVRYKCVCPVSLHDLPWKLIEGEERARFAFGVSCGINVSGCDK